MSEQQEQSTPVEKKKTKWVVPVIICVIVALLALILLIAISVSAPKRKYQRQLDLGSKYLTDLDYENAILAYEEALKIDPKCEDAYLALADIYLTLALENQNSGEYDKALSFLIEAKTILDTGAKEIESEAFRSKQMEIQKRIEEIETRKDAKNNQNVMDGETVEQHIRLSGTKTLDAENRLKYYEVYEYNDKSFDQPVKVISYNTDGTQDSCWTYEYNADKKVKANCSNLTGDYSLEYIYNEEGQLIKILQSGKTSTEYIYNSGVLIRFNSFDAQGNLSLYRDNYEYNERNQVIRCVIHQPEGKATQWEEYEYYPEGLLKKKRIFAEQGVGQSIEFKYDESGNIIEEKYYTGTELDEIKIYEYELVEQ